MNSIRAVPILFNAPAYRAEAEYALSELALRLGYRLVFASKVECGSSGPAAIYGRPEAGIKAPCIPYHAECYEQRAGFASIGFPKLWGLQGRGVESLDIIGGAFRLLALIDEAGVQEAARDERGIFKTCSLPAERFAVLEEPLFENHASQLGMLLLPYLGGASGLPTWPDGKKWALLLTHDTDALHLGAPLEVLYNSSKALLRRDKIRLNMARDGLHQWFGGGNGNQLFGFHGWSDLANQGGYRDAYYLYVRRHVRRTLNDCRSDVSDKGTDWAFLRKMAEQGYEFGLHPPILARSCLDEFIEGKRYLEEKIQQPIFGLRHHYWALDWRNPHLTYRMHVNAGFRYDLSMAWRDRAGLRPGTCMPFRPFDPVRNKSLDMYSVPTVLMDGHVTNSASDNSVAVNKACEVLQKVRYVGGIACLDWHTESACDDYAYRGHRSIFERLMGSLEGLDQAWIVTPWQLVRHWHQRRNKLLFEVTA